MGNVECRILGPLEVARDGAVVSLGGWKPRLIVAALALVGGPVSADRLTYHLWGDDIPLSAPGTLSAYISRLRRALGAEHLVREADGYRLQRVDTDAARFEALLEEADGDPQDDRQRLRTALDLWRGRFLGDLGDESFAVAERVRLEESRETATDRWFDAELAAGRHAEIVGAIEAAVDRSPLREARWERLMQALYRSGRQADALRAYRRAASILGEQLGIEPGERLRNLEEMILMQDPRLGRTIEAEARFQNAPAPTNLPSPPTTFVGRERETSGVAELVRSSDYVSLVGAGGVGKSRLAIEVAWSLLPERPGGAWWVDLTGLDTHQVASVVDSAAEDRTGALLVIDNADEVIDAVRSAVAALVSDPRDLWVLVTSRQPLLGPGEVVRSVPSLRREAGEDPAVELFVDRATTAQPAFRLTTANRDLVDRLLAATDGIPLAIELAAAQTALLGVGGVSAELEKGISVLATPTAATPRHETMHAAISWSYDRLDVHTQRRLTRLPAFARTFTQVGASFVAGIEDLDALVRGGFVVEVDRAFTDSARRFRLLEPIRQFLFEAARSQGTLDDARRAHFDHYLAMAPGLTDRYHGPDQLAAFRKARREADELERALEWALETGDENAAYTMAQALWWPWMRDGESERARQMLATVIEASTDPAHVLELSAAALLVGAGAGGPPDSISTGAGELLAAASDLDPRRRGMVSLLVGDALTAAGRLAEAEAPLTFARRAFDAAPSLAGWAALRLVRVYGLAGDIDKGREVLDDAEALLTEGGDLQFLAYAKLIRSSIARLHGKFEQAMMIADETEPLFDRLGHDPDRLEVMYLGAAAAVEAGRWEAAHERAAAMRRLAVQIEDDGWIDTAELLTAKARAGAGETGATAALHRLLDRDSTVAAEAGLVLSDLTVDDDTVAACDYLQRSAEYENSEHPWARAKWLVASARLALTSGDNDRAMAIATEAIEICTEVDYPPTHVLGLHVHAEAAASRAEWEQSVKLLAEADRMANLRDLRLPVREAARVNRLQSLLSAELGPDRFTALWHGDDE